MARHAQLNNVDHRDLRVVAERGAAWGDDVMSALTFPAEFRDVQSRYPIVFQKAPDGSLQPVALFGFRPGENLFLDANGWEPGYVPMSIERQPFLIGLSATGEPMVHIDLDHPRVGSARGEPLFRPHGGTTEYLDRATALLQALHDGLRAGPAFVDALLRLDLLESFVLDVELDDGSQHRLAGFYTIHEERLARLGEEALIALHREGHLQPIYMAIASLSHFRDLIDRVRAPGTGAG
ncbi:MAG: SapC family protein [Pseudomonadota bacterium]